MDRTRDITIGLLFISAFPLYGIGSSILETPPSDNGDDETSFSNVVGIGLLLVLANSVVVFIIGRMLKEIVAPIDKFAADAYIHVRFLEALLLALTASINFYNYHRGEMNGSSNSSVAQWCYRIAMIGLGTGSMPLLTALKNAKLIPIWLGWSGIVGYFCVVIGIDVDAVGEEDLGMLLMIPGALFEITFAVWLIVRGFNFDGYEEME